MKALDMEMLAKGLGMALRPKLAAFEIRLARLEAAAGIGPDAKAVAAAYQGIWKQGNAYTCGQLVSHSGSLWLAKSDTISKPGSTRAWTLVSKNGQRPKGAA